MLQRVLAHLKLNPLSHRDLEATAASPAKVNMRASSRNMQMPKKVRSQDSMLRILLFLISALFCSCFALFGSRDTLGHTPFRNSDSLSIVPYDAMCSLVFFRVPTGSTSSRQFLPTVQ